MTVWVNRAQVGPRTHALIIGVSEYEHLPQVGGPDPDDVTALMDLGQLECGASAALAMATWVRDTYFNPAAPLGSVRLFMSPSAKELASLAFSSLGCTVPRARKNEVGAAINAWWNDCQSNPHDVALFYAAGHGIELSKDDGAILLLEDFNGKMPDPLGAALDTGNLRRGMTGPGMPSRQVYFVDACRVQPQIASEYIDRPVGLNIFSSGTGASTAPMYFSAASGTQAYGFAGKGTFFSQALIECMDLLAVRPDDTGDKWQVTEGSLVMELGPRVAEIGGAAGYPQMVVVGGSMTGAIIHEAPACPRLAIDIQVDPAAATSCAKATVVNEPDPPITVDHPLPARITVPAGLYTVKVRIDPQTPGYADNAAVCAAEPPRPRPNPVVVRV